MKNTKPEKLVLFDIDGIIVKAGHPILKKSFPYAIKKVFNLDIPYNINQHYGSTDRKIFFDLLQAQGIKEDRIKENLIKLFRLRKNYFLANITPDYKQWVIKPAINLAKTLKRSGIKIGLLTGNYQELAYAKFAYFGLNNLFNFGVFGNMAENRNALAKLAPQKAKEHFGSSFSLKNIFIIGDTPRDVACGKAAKVNTIAVASGHYTVEDLQKTGADLVVDNLANKKVLEFILKND